MSQSPVVRETLTIRALDAYPLAATRYLAQGPVRGNLIIAGATGVPQGFYRRFAEYAARQGFTTLTLDYRGIGQSRPASLKGCEFRFVDWAEKDLPAAVEALATPAHPLFMIGHSYGGHAFGLLPNHHKVARFYTFATGSGWHGWMPWHERLKVQLAWQILLPALTRWKGYSPWAMIGLGEDLPTGVYAQWRRWCQYPHYFFDDPTMTDVQQRFDEVSCPVVFANALDDLWALPPSREAFLKHAYRNSPVERVSIDPRAYGGLGHMGYFRPQAQALWQNALDWFSQHEA